jgi:hypothetical protein
VNACAELSDDNITRPHRLAAKHFDTAPLSLTVTAIARATACFFMCHIRSALLTFNSGDFESGLMLPMTALATVTLASFLFENQHLLRFCLTDNLTRHRGVLYQRRTDFNLAIAANKQDISQSYLFADLAGKLLDLYEITLRYPVLLSTSFDDCIFHVLSRMIFLTEISAKVNNIRPQDTSGKS